MNSVKRIAYIFHKNHLLLFVCSFLLLLAMSMAAPAVFADPADLGNGTDTSTSSNTTNNPPPASQGPTLWGYSFPDISYTLYQIEQTLPALNRFVSILSYLLGIYMIFKALSELKKYGESRTMMSSQTDLRGPVIMMIAGIACLFFPTMIDVGLNTVFGDDSILSYSTTENDLFAKARNVIVGIVWFVGAVAFLRGLILFYKTGTGQAEQKSTSRAIAHLIGGILCLNIVATKNVIYSTLGILSN